MFIAQHFTVEIEGISSKLFYHIINLHILRCHSTVTVLPTVCFTGFSNECYFTNVAVDICGTGYFFGPRCVFFDAVYIL